MEINVCPICQREFTDWPMYHEHLNLAHGVVHQAAKLKETEPIVIDIFEAVQIKVTPANLQRRQYVPMDLGEKRRIVAAWELRQTKGAIIE